MRGNRRAAQANTDWEDAGEISDIILSLAGDNEAVLVDFGGFLGMGEKTVALTSDMLRLVTDPDSMEVVYIVTATQEQLEAMPTDASA